MVIFSTNRKNTETKMEKNVCRDICFKKIFAEDNFSSPPPPLQKNNGPSRTAMYKYKLNVHTYKKLL